MGNVAAIDCGTLSTRLLVSEADGRPLARLMRITRLGQGVDARRRLHPDAVGRTLSVLGDYRAVMDELGATALRMVGTSALRDAADREAFSEQAGAVVGAPLELLSGEEEAGLSFLGATHGLDPATGPWLVVDIGGGSTELVAGPGVSVSMDIGCVRLAERALRGDPPTGDELAAARQWLDDELRGARESRPGLAGRQTLVGLAGTVSALACWAQGTDDRRKAHRFRLSRGMVQAALAELASMPARQRAALPGLEPGRAPHILAGTIILDAVMGQFAHQQCLVSEEDILDGLVLTLLQPPGQRQ